MLHFSFGGNEEGEVEVGKQWEVYELSREMR